jgi:hypothetical protein
MSELLKPPSFPAAVLNFFSHQPDYFAVAGDMSEEFQERARTAGPAAAKLWYWRETFRNAWALTAREVLRTPGRTFFLALVSLLAVNILIFGYVAIRYPRWFQYSDAMEMVFDPRQSRAFLALQFIVPMCVGWIAAKLLPGREWALALLFTLLSISVALPAAWYLFVMLKVKLPAQLINFVNIEIALRLSAFMLGCLWTRRARLSTRRS